MAKTKHVILAVSDDGVSRYVTGSRGGGLSSDLSEAALFDSGPNALAAAKKLRAKDIERKNGVRLQLGEVSLSIIGVTDIPRKAADPGFLLKRQDGKYYAGAKTRLPKDFMDANYRYVANPESATVFPTEERAQATVQAIREILRGAADDEVLSTASNGGYLRIWREFSCELVQV